MNIDTITTWARLKGIHLMGTGDFTHPSWLGELRRKLVEQEYGIFQNEGIRYLLTAEVNNIYRRGDRSHKVHNILIVPSFAVAEQVNKVLAGYGDLTIDGRPIVSVPCDVMVKQIRAVSNDVIVIPAHAWTPHFSVFGANAGFDAIEDCFGDQTPFIHAIETGLSSDPAMNWRWSALDRISLVSNSDAHSPMKIGREANVFKNKFGYRELIDILNGRDKEKFLFTVEFYPEEGKYHWDGHRACKVRLSPSESKSGNCRCPRCGRKVTVGVMHRVEKLCDRPEGFILKGAPSFKKMVPLVIIIGAALDMGTETKRVRREYQLLIEKLGNEFRILIEIPDDDIKKNCPPRIAQAIINARHGRVRIDPGYDGEYGTVDVLGDVRDTQLQLF
ncbi:MAG: endonuclease Q family protein [Candidatus Omnitrophica bacterium]|nr:endonuclease Q family protein [Candidatus Omnitrophota bacterium]